VFFAFAPQVNPKIAIAVYVENAGWGASYAAPIASLMMEKYLNDTIATARKPLEEKMAKANIIEKFLASRPPARLPAAPAARRDSLPNPKDIPSDVPSGQPALGVTTSKDQRKR